ncbi:MAG: deoxyguanosinetriphosphate triphosphohydrolase [Clostridiales bacterium]|nr:deoxyguanosinetriphosphate triphosphohydrolase [Clostridiales bacterium]
MNCIREYTEKNEHLFLSDSASFADRSSRINFEQPCPLRTSYQRDRDRIIHSGAFRRLKHKTQVFLSPEGDRYRTRLTHTLEVAQIARTIARALRLNEDLTEAIALGHDLGHTPFGHAGERVLRELCSNGFYHFKQSLRVVDRLEKEGKGLNLTNEVRNGIERHTGGEPAFTLEGQIVRLADKIAYINHDIEDATAAGVMTEDDIPLFIRQALGFSKSERINSLVTDCVENSKSAISLSDETELVFNKLHSFMFDSVYTNPVCKSEESRAQEMIRILFNHFVDVPEEMPALYREIALTDGVETAVCDYIAGMTDRYAVNMFEELFIPKAWTVK